MTVQGPHGLQESHPRSAPTASGFARDLRHAIRALARAPGFTVIATLTIALGIGANAAIFSVINTVLLRPLPYRDAPRLVRVYESLSDQPGWHGSVSVPNYRD
ncbi:MAG: hypothetical protein ABIT38_08225 [Gemmatimonadaceae bacterium]